MLTYKRKYSEASTSFSQLQRWADARNTTLSVAREIWGIAESSREAHRIWKNPTEKEFNLILKRLYDSDEDGSFYWGEEKLEVY